MDWCCSKFILTLKILIVVTYTYLQLDNNKNFCDSRTNFYRKNLGCYSSTIYLFFFKLSHAAS